MKKLSLGLVLSLLATSAFAQAWTPSSKDGVKVVGNDGSYHDANFYTEAQAAGAANTGALAGSTVTATTSFKLGANLIASNTAPVIASGFGTSPAVTVGNNTVGFEITVGTSNSGSGVITLPTAPNGWFCDATDITTTSTTVAQTKESANSATSCTLQNYSDVAVAHAWVDGDVILINAVPF